MPTKCEHCGHIHWDESQSLARYAAWVADQHPEQPITSRLMADSTGTSIQNANNQLRRLEALGIVEDMGRDSQDSGGVQRFWTHYLTHRERDRLLDKYGPKTYQSQQS